MSNKEKSSQKILDRNFFEIDAVSLAQNLIGKVIVRKLESVLLKARIIETEAYMGASDSASHSYRMRKTKRVEPMYQAGGFTYVYFTYGMHYCLNIVANSQNIPEAVLIRAVEFISGIEYLERQLSTSNFLLKKSQWANGPAKLCQRLKINATLNNIDLINNNILYLEDDNFVVKQEEIIATKRINIDRAINDRDKFWRFYLKDSIFISKTIKK